MRIIRLRDVMRCTGLSRSTIYKFINEGIFPTSVTLGGRAVGWVEEEVESWVQARIGERDALLSGSAPCSETASGALSSASRHWGSHHQGMHVGFPCLMSAIDGSMGWAYTYRYSVDGVLRS